MNFELTEEQIQVRDMVREFAANERSRPIFASGTPKSGFHREVLDKMGELGILGLPIPEQYGGLGLDYVSSPWPARSLSASTRRCACHKRPCRPEQS